MDIFVEVVKLATVGLMAGLFSSYMANRDFRLQRWWERRADAYTRVIEALSDLIDYYGELFDAETEGRQLTKEHEAELRSHWREGQRLVRRAADLGAFLFSTEASEALREFRRASSITSHTYAEYLDNYYGATKKCLDAIVNCSTRDLKLPRGVRRFFSRL